MKIPVLDVSTKHKNIDSYIFEYFIRYNIKIRSVSAENDQPGKLFSSIPPVDHSEAHYDSQGEYWVLYPYGRSSSRFMFLALYESGKIKDGPIQVYLFEIHWMTWIN